MHISEWIELDELQGDLSQYRVRAVSLLRKYFKMSVELGHLPSLLGKEFFRSQVTSYTTHTFEDAVIFVHDMEQALAAIDPRSQMIIARVIFQEYSYEEAAGILGMSSRHFLRSAARALDSLSELLLARELMDRSRMPVSAQKTRGKKPPQSAPVSLEFLRSLRNPKVCQARKIARIGLTR